MFGYIQIHQSELKMKDYDKYRSFYCGLCHILKQRYGRKGQMLLNYDMTFLAILLDGLYEEKQQESRCRCVAHPVVAHRETVTDEITLYAADMTVMLAYQKALDDWRDEKKPSARALMLMLGKDYRTLRSTYPRQAHMLEKCVRQLSVYEREGDRDIDRVSGLTGKFLGEMFVWKEDIWQEDLRNMGFFLGKFIYLMDAYDDLEKDKKKHRYNILKDMEIDADAAFDERVRSMLEDMMSPAARAFEHLPVIRNADMLRNILYSGVWVKCAAVKERRQQKRKET